jgi:SAM-dependent methyltransferase
VSVRPDQDSWETAVAWYRATASRDQVQANYFDLPVSAAAERFERSAEFKAVLRALAGAPARRVLDVGAGNGIASYAFAVNGWSVEAVEPDPSALVGAAAISALAATRSLDLQVHRELGERLPLDDASVGAVHARQVLHHLRDLRTGLAEMHRVLMPRGIALCTREHVVDGPEQLETFLAAHPLHHRYGGENAYPLSVYLDSAREAGFVVDRIWGPVESPINAHPLSETARRAKRTVAMLKVILGEPAAVASVLRSVSVRPLDARARDRDSVPGRLYSFRLRKAG